MPRSRAPEQLPDLPCCRSTKEAQALFHTRKQEALMGRGILMWLVGVPIPIIILILLFWR
jgi:hypothetical protein